MATVYKIKNTSGVDGDFAGQSIANDETYLIDTSEITAFREDADLFKAIANGDIEVSSDIETFIDPLKGWSYLEGDNMPRSKMDGKKLSVHTSYKPEVTGVETYVAWTGAGDDLDNDIIGGGDLVHFNMQPGTTETSIDIKFLQNAGRVWIHEGYLKFVGGGVGDYLSALIMAPPSVLQTAINLDLVVSGDEVLMSPSGAGTGTHGFAATPNIIPRSYNKDGAWDWSEAGGLVPNMTNTGRYKIKTVETATQRYINKIPCYGDCSTYFSMSSDETSEIFYPYFIRVTCHNGSDSNWHASVITEIYREKTI